MYCYRYHDHNYIQMYQHYCETKENRRSKAYKVLSHIHVVRCLRTNILKLEKKHVINSK